MPRKIRKFIRDVYSLARLKQIAEDQRRALAIERVDSSWDSSNEQVFRACTNRRIATPEFQWRDASHW
jgi:hypothetical protein